jgi:hypothetical protein
MPNQKHHRILIWAVFLSLASTIAIQMLYPINKALPLARVANQSVGLMPEVYLAANLNEAFDNTRVVLAVGDSHQKEYSLKQLGAEPNTQNMINKLTSYPTWQRFIPFSIFWQPAKVNLADVYFANIILSQQAKIIASEFSFNPQNATIMIKGGEIIMKEAASGSQAEAENTRRAVIGSLIKLGDTTTINVPHKEVKAARFAKDLSSVYQQAQQIVDHAITILVGNQTFTPSHEEITNWIIIREDETNTLTLDIDKEKVLAYVAGINTAFATEPGTVHITIVNGYETGRTKAASGQKLDVDLLTMQLTKAIAGEHKEVTINAQFVEVAPKIIYNNTYSASEEGLRAYVNDVANSKNVQISLVQLNGNGWTASARETESIPSGSTYKLFVALVLFDKIDKGEIHWDNPILDTNVSVCFDRMTIASTNPCAIEWINQFGRQYINNFIYARGFSSGTSFTTGGANQTTAADLTRFMIGLEHGTLLSGANRERLLYSLSVHPYKYGIQTGSQGKSYDKVGFLWDYIHNTAIVYHPRGTYVVTIMTKGQSYATIAAITKELERIMYP